MECTLGTATQCCDHLRGLNHLRDLDRETLTIWGPWPRDLDHLRALTERPWPPEGLDRETSTIWGPWPRDLDHLSGLDHLSALDYLNTLDHLSGLEHLRGLDYLRGLEKNFVKLFIPNFVLQGAHIQYQQPIGLNTHSPWVNNVP